MDLGVTLLELAAALLLARGAVGHVCADTMLRRWARPGPRPPISVLIAVQEPHDCLYENLVALVCQRYPSFELVLAVDPAGVTAYIDPTTGEATHLDVARRRPIVRPTTGSVCGHAADALVDYLPPP